MFTHVTVKWEPVIVPQIQLFSSAESAKKQPNLHLHNLQKKKTPNAKLKQST